MESLTFYKAGTSPSLAALDISSLQFSIADNYPAVTLPPVVHIAQFGGAQVNGFAGAARLGGVFVQPAHVVLGLKAWDDAFEGVLAGETPWVLFEAEKIVRMMLRQSGLALEILASLVAKADFDAVKVVRGAITREIVLYYRDVTRLGISRLLALVESESSGDPCLQQDWSWMQDLFRNLLTGCVLGHEGHVSLHLEDLLDARIADGVREPLGSLVVGETAAVRELGKQAVRLQGLLALESALALPERPSNYDGLNDWLVAQRLAAGAVVAGTTVGRRNGP